MLPDRAVQGSCVPAPDRSMRFSNLSKQSKDRLRWGGERSKDRLSIGVKTGHERTRVRPFTRDQRLEMRDQRRVMPCRTAPVRDTADCPIGKFRYAFNKFEYQANWQFFVMRNQVEWRSMVSVPHALWCSARSPLHQPLFVMDNVERQFMVCLGVDNNDP